MHVGVCVTDLGRMAPHRAFFSILATLVRVILCTYYYSAVRTVLVRSSELKVRNKVSPKVSSKMTWFPCLELPVAVSTLLCTTVCF